MRSQEYWQRRSESVLLAAERQGNELIKKLDEFYAEATINIERDVEAFYGRYADNNEISIQEAKKRISSPRLESFKKEMERYYSEAKRLGLGKDYEDYLRRLSARGYISRQEELLAQVRHEVEKLTNRELEAFLDDLPDVYENSYYHTVFDVQQGLGFGTDFNRLDTDTVESIIKRPWLGSSFSDRIWQQKDTLITRLDRIIPQAFATGENSRILGQRLAKQMNTSRYNGERLARTEVNHAANEATRSAYKETGVEQYEYLATLDNRTSEICAALDGKVFRVADAQVGTNYPPMHPNCRSTTVPYFEPDEFDEPSVRAARNKDGKYYTVPANLTYRDWKKSVDSGIMPVSKKVGSADVHTIGYIDIEKYKGVADSIITDEVVLTNNRIDHINERRGLQFLKNYGQLLTDIVQNPDYIFKDSMPNTAIVSKRIKRNGTYVNIVLKLAVEGDDIKYKNSIITAIKENDKRFAQRLRNNKPVYSSKR